MALEGIVLNAGSGGQKLATDTVGGFDFQIIKIGVGADDSTPTSVSDSNPMPVDDAGGSLTVDNGGTFVVQEDGAALTALQLIDDIVQAEDAIHGSGDSGVMALAVRNDVLAALAGTDGDYAPLQVNASGALYVEVDGTVTVGSHAVTNAGTFVVQEDGAALTALQLIDNIVSVEDAVHGSGDSGVMALAVRNDTLAALAGADGDYAPLQVNASGALFIQEGAALDVSAATLTVNAHAVTNAGTFVVQEDGAALTALQLIDNIVQVEDAVHGSGDSGVMSLAVRNDVLATLAGADGDYAPLQVNASGALFIQEGAALDVSAATITVAAHAVTNAGTFVVQEDGAALTALQVIDNPVFADDDAFTLASSGVMVAGAIRDDALSTLTAIENDAVPLRVDSTGALHVTGGGGGTQFAEDSVHGSGDLGTMALVVRNDVLASLVTADGDYAPLQVNASGALFIQEGTALDVSAATLTVNAHAVTNAGTFVVQEDGAALTALQLIDNIVHVDDAAFTPGTGSVVPAGALFDDAAPDSVNEGDAGILRMSANRNLYATLRDAAGNERGVNVDASNRLTVSVDNTVTVGSHAVTNAGTFAVQEDGAALTALQLIDNIVQVEDVAHSSGQSGVMALAVRNDALAALATTDGDYAPLQVNASGALYIQEGAALDVSAATLTVNAHAVTNAGTFVVQEDGAALTALQLIDDSIFADDAAFTLASSKVSMAGAIRDDALTTLTAIEGDAVPLRVNSTGALHVTGSAGVTEFNEDAASAGGEAGNVSLGVRRDADTSPVTADNDYHTMIFDATGNLKVNVKAGSAAGTEFNEDTAHSSGAAGTLSLGVRQDADTSPVNADLDYHTLIFDNAGNLKVNVKASASHAVTNAGTFVVQEDGAALTALQLIDNIVQVEDAVHGSGDSGVMALAVRNDVLAALAGTDGDYAPLQVNASGALYVEVDGTVTVGSHAVTNVGTFVVQEDGAALTALQLIDDAVFADDAPFTLTTDKVMMSGVIVDAALSALAAVDGDAVPMRVNANGALHVTGSAGVTEFNEDTAHTTGAAGNISLGVRRDADTSPVTADNDYHTMIFDATGSLKVNVKSSASHAVTNAGTFVVQENGAALTALQLIDDPVFADNDPFTFSSSKVMVAGAIRDDVLGALVPVQGDAVPLRVNSVGALHTTGGGEQHDEDAPHTTGDTGTVTLVVRNDALATLVDTDGDYAPLQVNASGALFIQEGVALDVSAATLTVNAHAVTNTGTFATQATLQAGTAAFGKLSANSGVDIGDVDVTSQPARASTTDSIKAVLATDTVMDGTTAEVPIRVAFDVSASGDNEIVALVASNKIRVLSLAMNAFGDVEAEFQSGGTTTNLSGTFDLGTSAGKAKGLVLAFSPIGHFESASGTALDLNLSAAVQVSGHLVYIVVAA